MAPGELSADLSCDVVVGGGRALGSGGLPEVNTALPGAASGAPGGVSPASCTTRRAMAGAGSIHATGHGASALIRSSRKG